MEGSALLDAPYLRFVSGRLHSTKIQNAERQVVGRITEVVVAGTRTRQARDDTGAVAWIQVVRRTRRERPAWHHVLANERQVSDPDESVGIGYINSDHGHRLLWLADGTHVGSLEKANPWSRRHVVLDNRRACVALITRKLSLLGFLWADVYDLTFTGDPMPTRAARTVVAASVSICRTEDYDDK